MKHLELGTYKFVKQPNQHTKWYQRLWAQIVWYTKMILKLLTIGGVTGAVLYSAFLIGQYSSPLHVKGQETIDLTPDKIEKLKDEVIDSISKQENELNIPSIPDDNKAKSLPLKDKVSYGCMQFKIGTIEHYYSVLNLGPISDQDAAILAIQCDRAKALAKKIIFETQGGIFNWSVATKEMTAKIEIIKELMK